MIFCHFSKNVNKKLSTYFLYFDLSLWQVLKLNTSSGRKICSFVFAFAYKVNNTVELGDKERFDKEYIDVKELYTHYQPFYSINLLLDKELLPIKKMPKLGVSEHEIVKISKKRGLLKYFLTNFRTFQRSNIVFSLCKK
jgi:hypothetical protein